MGAVETLLPRLVDLHGFAAVFVVCGIFVLAGRVLCNGRGGPEINVLVGWGVAAVVFTLWGVASPLSMKIPATGIFALAILALAFRRFRPTRTDLVELGRVLVVAGPLLLVLAGKQVSQVDAFTHWLANAVYLMDHDMFPGEGRPSGLGSGLEAFPYNLQFPAYMASLLSQDVPTAALTHTNIFLQLAFSLVAARVVAGTWLDVNPEGDSQGPVPWWACALGVLMATALNPAFVPNIAFTSYGDPSTAVTLALALALGWRLLERLRIGRSMVYDGISLAAMLVVLVNLKQANLSLLAIVILALLVVAAWDRSVPLTAAIKMIAVVAGPAVIIYASWRGYVAANLGGQELGFLPLSDWDFGSVPAILAKMLHIASHKGGYFGMMALLIIAAAWGARHRKLDPATRLVALVALSFVGYVLALTLVYVTAFKGLPRLGAQSFWRYQTQLGPAGVLATAVAVRHWGGPWLAAARPLIARRLPVAPVVLVLVLPVVFVDWLRRDLDPPKPFVREAMAALARDLPRDARLAIIHHGDNGNLTWLARGVLLLMPPRRPDLHIDLLREMDSGALDAAAARDFDHVWIYCVPSEVARMLEPQIDDSSAHLLHHDGDEWRPVASWPYPPPWAAFLGGSTKFRGYGCN